MREQSIEEYLISSVKALGLDCIKFHPDSKAGMPDRLVLLRDGAVVWVELKTEGGELSELQKYQHRKLAQLGHRVETLWCKSEVDKFINSIQ